MSGQIGHFRFPEDDDASAGPDYAAESAVRPDSQGFPEPNFEGAKVDTLSVPARLTGIGALMIGGFVAILAVLSVAPYWARTPVRRSIEATCQGVRGTPYYDACVAQARGRQARAAHLHWNAWGSWLSWPAIVLFLIIAAVIAFKAVFSKSEKVVLSRQVKLGLVLADLLFLVSVFHIPHDNAGRAWGLWLSLVCVIGINVGILLSTTEVGEWIAERWPKRVKLAVPPTPAQRPGTPQHADYRPTPQAMPPGHRQPNWPPPAGQQQVPSNQFPPNDLR